MKELAELNLPANFRYTKDHEWIESSGNVMKIGISDYAQDQLGEIVFVELPQPGTILNQGEQLGTVESVKAVSEIFMPASGEVVQINTALADAPELVNRSPYEEAWMIEIKASVPDEIKTLMDRDAYLKFLEGIK